MIAADLLGRRCDALLKLYFLKEVNFIDDIYVDQNHMVPIFHQASHEKNC